MDSSGGSDGALTAAGTGIIAPQPLETLASLRDAMRTFVSQRGWEKFHTPRNLLLALTGEVGELAEIFRWEGELQPGLPTFSAEKRCASPPFRAGSHSRAPAARSPHPFRAPGAHPHRSHHLGEELADVLLFLVRMGDVCGVDLALAAVEKMQKNRRNYPVEKCFGSSAKHTAYKEGGAEGGGSGGGGRGGGGEGGAGARGGSAGAPWGAVVVPAPVVAVMAPLAIAGAWAVFTALRARK